MLSGSLLLVLLIFVCSPYSRDNTLIYTFPHCASICKINFPHRFLLEVVLIATPKHNQGNCPSLSHTHTYLCWQTKMKPTIERGQKKDNLLVTQNVSTIGNRKQIKIIIKLTERTVNLGVYIVDLLTWRLNWAGVGH